MELWEFFKTVILGIVEGLTEFAPVSSTGHMIIVDDMWLKSAKFLGEQPAVTFKVVIQLGSILAVVVLFWRRFLDLLGLRRMSPASAAKEARVEGTGEWATGGSGRLKLMQVIVGLIPAGVIGLLLDSYIEEHLFSTGTVLVGLVLGALLMIAADRFGPRTPKVQTVDQITYKQALGMGLVQCVSLWPGFSRSGSTISGGVLLGMSHRAAADFTFIMAVPIMAGASALTLLKNYKYITGDVLPYFIVGFIAAFLVALVSIRFFLALINRIKLVPFAIYRILLAAVIALVFYL
ncbi:undecaprenyl-diphosphate phosphatase [Cohnella nanjingensis]|uniref:Undecaprenyl-diphosphatase n=1 Tax=Cohnella nanjingensis TaxID=1387779 RepID=A0A7X0RVH2_9BACL|nr:undecaprenyl-diphosphate phosphatase [Cohnella nanjingensis]MBB6674346.1 undecaprenyl-diphosphate phosphatase [Cohnella nanjingensis]